MPKIYKISLVIRPNDEAGPEQRWETTVLARSEHQAHRKIIEAVLAMNYLVSHFLQVEQCK